MDTKVSGTCSYSQGVHSVVKEMTGPKEVSKYGEGRMEANTGTAKEEPGREVNGGRDGRCGRDVLGGGEYPKGKEKGTDLQEK